MRKSFTEEELCELCCKGLLKWSTSSVDLDATYEAYNQINYSDILDDQPTL